MHIENLIQKYIAENLLFSSEGYAYDNDASFLQEGIIDSMGVMELVTFVSTTFAIQVEPHEVLPENFDSVNKLAEFIRRKEAAKPQSARVQTAEAVL
jgi:acyl carrier protein